MNIRTLIKHAFRRMGLEAWPISSIPRGISLEQDLRRIFVHNGTGPLTLFDVGANVGQTTTRFKKAFPSAKVYSFEPIPSTFAKLVANCKTLRGTTCVNMALGEKSGSATMQIVDESGSNRIISGAPAAMQKTEVVTLGRLDAWCAENGIGKIDLLKTDCEGYDLEVVKGGEKLLASGSIVAVYCEVNFSRDGRCGDYFALEAFLRSRGFVFYALYDYSGWQYNIATEGFANALFVQVVACQEAAARRGQT